MGCLFFISEALEVRKINLVCIHGKANAAYFNQRWTDYTGLDPESRSLNTTSTIGNTNTNAFQNTFSQAVTPALAQFIATLNLTF